MIDLPTIHVFAPHQWSSLNTGLFANGATSAAYTSANLAIYYPVRVFQSFTATFLFVLNGSVVSGNIDIGIYSQEGNRIVSSGSTAQSGTTAVQSFDIADTYLVSGVYFLAIAMDNTTGTIFNQNNDSRRNRMSGSFRQSSAFPLPATATFAANTSGPVYWIGMTNRSFV